MTELCDLGAVELRRLMGSRRISPVELLESCLARIDAVNPTVNALTATCVARARDEARASEARIRRGEPLGVLEGLPLGVKDLNETEGLRTTWGSPIWRDHVPTRDERMVAACRAAGAIVVGKTNVPEFGAGANTNNPVYGPTRNPFDLARICGGSSGGSAVALATGMLPVCTGSDTGGSLRTPAAFCGVVGFRVSPGTVPTERRPLGWTNISVQGPMGRDVADTALLLSAQAAFDPDDPLSRPVDAAAFRHLAPIDPGRLRIAYTEDWGICPIDPGIAATFRARIAALGRFVARCDVVTPEMGRAHAAFGVLRAVGMLQSQRDNYARHRALLGPNIVANYEEGLRYSAADVAWAQAEQTRIYRAVQAVFRDYDLILSPTVAVPPFPWSQLYQNEIGGRRLNTYFHWFAPTYMISLTGNPSLSLPMGLEPSGTPFGMMITGPAARDHFTLSAAQAIERAIADDPALCQPRPDLAALARAPRITDVYEVSTPPLDPIPWTGAPA